MERIGVVVMNYYKQLTRAELKQLNFDKLREEYNNLCKAYIELQNNYKVLSRKSIEVVFSEYNDDIEILARELYKQNLIKAKKNFWLNPNVNENTIKLKEIKDE